MLTRIHRLARFFPVAVALAAAFSPIQAEAAESWNDWYALDRGQDPGERAVNPWGDPGIPGQSICKYPSTPTGLPAAYEGESMAYFLNKWDVVETAEYSEVLTIHGTDDIYLDRWASGVGSAWTINYSPYAFGGAPSCTVAAVQAQGDRTLAGLKEPISTRLPSTPGQTLQSNLVCAAVFGDEQHPYDYDVVSSAAWEWVEVETHSINGSTVSATAYTYTSDMSLCLDGYETAQYALFVPPWSAIYITGCVSRITDLGMSRVTAPQSGGLYDVGSEDLWNPGSSASDGGPVYFSIEAGSC